MEQGRPETSRGNIHHVPALADAAIEYLRVRPDGQYIDCTAGYGGHAERIARQLGGTGRLGAIDCDSAAVSYATDRLRPFGERVAVVRANFAELATVLADLGMNEVDGVLFDLGVSLPQLRDETGRGFSFIGDAPLDMRMDQRQPTTAADVVNTWPEDELARIFREYGDERYARAVARAIVRTRDQTPLRSTGDLAAMVTKVVARRRPAKGRRRRRHPATRVFQAVRMAVNGELENFRTGFEAAVSALAGGGRLCVISFHSVEHRTVRRMMREHARPCTCPPGISGCVCGARQDLVVVTKKAVVPDEQEIAVNPQARSAQLRVAEKRAVSA